jgi:hypothetical protein
MPVDRRRIGAAAGILAAILAGVGFGLFGSLPKADHLNNAYTDYLRDKRSKILISTELIGLAFAFLLLFLAALRTHLGGRASGTTAAAEEDRTLTNAAVLGASVAVALNLAGIAVLAGVAFKAASTTTDEVNRAFFDVSNAMVTIGSFPFALFFASVGVVALGNGTLPRPWALIALLLAVINLLGGLALFAKSGLFANGGAWVTIAGITSTVWILGTAVLMFRDASVAGAPPTGATRIADRPAACAIAWYAAAGSGAPKIAEPATKVVAPASAQRGAVLVSTPPSTSRAGPSPVSARRRRILSTDSSMNAWPPQPGFTVMHSARSRSPAICESTSTGVAGQTATPAPQPAARIACTA